jgi:hypothetical protein
VAGLAALGARAAVLPVLPIAEPAIHDEFAYLLLADTFAHGRLTNPTHPMWVHFESFHIIWRPTYTAMFYPAQGLIMALGQVLVRHPFWGVWLSVGLMCAAICWMLQGWLPPGWALLGGLLAVIRLGTFSYWANSYWGGAVAATGGALVLGALPRIKRSQRPRDALLMGAGLALIANSRPYEGLLFGLPVATALLMGLRAKDRPSLPLIARRVVAPLLLVLILTLGAMGYYFWRTTGSPWHSPYLVSLQTYKPVPYFAWQSLKPAPDYHHDVMRAFYLGPVLDQYRASRTIAGLASMELLGLVGLWGFFLGPALTLPLLAVVATAPYGFSWKDLSKDTRFLLLVSGAVTAATMTVSNWSFPHFAAPVTCAIYALVLQAMHRIRPWQWRTRSTGFFITRAVPSVCVLLLLLRAGAGPLRLALPTEWPWHGGAATWCSPEATNVERARVLHALEQYPGRHIVIVRYKPEHDTASEWVYNAADIDGAKVVWARDMGAARNKELVRYFKDRRVWLVNADDRAPKLAPYPVSADQPSWSGVQEEVTSSKASSPLY